MIPVKRLSARSPFRCLTRATIRAFSWWLQPQGEHNVRLQTGKESDSLALLLPSEWRPLPRFIPETWTKQQAEQRKRNIKQESLNLFEVEQKGTHLFSDSLDESLSTLV
jgi:hypothetical protein